MKIAFRNILFLNCIFLGGLLTHSLYRDIRLEKQFPSDLRNRIVGARLQKDGKLPYHYHWKETDGIRYYNPDDYLWQSDSVSGFSAINEITSSPFFHELLYPICDLSQRTLSAV
jgi:hypothetical protein